MRDIDKAIRLYLMMAYRCEQSGFAPRQSAVYREMAELMKGCETAEEASVKIKNSSYFLAPSLALMQDKLAAFERAYRENEMPDVADVYRKKREEIETDAGSMYETGYEQAAQRLKTRYGQASEAFTGIYRCYLSLLCSSIIDEASAKKTQSELKENLNKLGEIGFDFSMVAADEKYRKLIQSGDIAYERFVKTVLTFCDSPPDLEDEKRQVQAEYNEALKILAEKKDSVLEAGRVNRQRIKRSLVTVVSPDSKAGGYSYIDEEVIAF